MQHFGSFSMHLRSVAISDEVSFELFRDEMGPEQWNELHKNLKKFGQYIEDLNQVIREYVHGSTGRTQQSRVAEISG